MTSAEIRNAFLDFFRSKEHAIVPSAPMVIKNDPTLMFTNAGMNQFKDIFLGNRDAASRRIADTQKCLRVSGKHNDLEEVGHDTYHHTMFEMLGNWSFGDYFKREAIAWGWELLTEVYGIDKEILYVTVFEGDPAEGLEMDREAYDIWKEFIPEERILLGSKKDNFWEMGDSGPCGPCSEIHADIRDAEQRKSLPGRDLVNQGDPHVIEIWNLVFIQYNRLANRQLVPLPARHVDTGMGFERLCMVLQKKKSNYDTDVFQPLINEIALMADTVYGRDQKADIAMRVIADHIRAVSFAIADGQLPSNVKAGYVIRRILRRAVRYGYAFLGFREPFMHELVPTLSGVMGEVFPELSAQRELVINVIREEESAFLRTLSTGIQRFNTYVEQSGSTIIDGAFAFELFDTYGFPVDLTDLMAREQGLSVDMEGFKKGLEAQKSRSRQDAAVDTADWVVVQEHSADGFVGYDTLACDALITRYRKVETKGESFFHVVLAPTPFYAESGGQVGDRGWILAGEEKIEVIDTIRENDLIIHITTAIPAQPAQPVQAVVNGEKRRRTAGNHSATHLMHAALRRILGTHVEQKGSLVDENRLRFDFTHFARLSKEEIARVEAMVNERIRENIHTGEERSVPVEEAKKRGAMALFGEKYGDTVRVITFDPGYSVELCGGTHVNATGQIGPFKIISESGIAAGIRRIEAITGPGTDAWWQFQETLIEEIGEALKHPKDLLRGIKNLIEENKQLKRQVAELGKLKTKQMVEEFKARVVVLNGIRFLAEQVDLEPDAIKDLAYTLQGEIENLFLVLASESDGKASLTVMLSDSLVNERKMHAGNIIRELAREIQGGGGGQPGVATAGGKNAAGIPAALERARAFVAE